MTWKSYATVSGATVLAGWLASTSPVPAPGSSVPAARPVAAVGSSDIVQQADRLQARVARARAYSQPARDPFRFAGRAPEATASRSVPASDDGPGPVEVRPAIPRVVLSGIAEDQVDGRPVRTAVLSVPSDVLLVQEGEEILGRYRVLRIESEAVELLDLTSGTTERLSLR